MINFFLLQNEKTIIVTEKPLSKIKEKYANKFEILTTIKDKESIDIISQRLQRQYPTHEIKVQLRKKTVISEEGKRRISEAQRKKRLSPEVKARISQARKGKGNFTGKRHTEESKRKTSLSSKNKFKNKDKIWIYNPREDNEKKVTNRLHIPPGFMLGRNPDVTEILRYHLSVWVSTNPPMGRPPKRAL